MISTKDDLPTVQWQPLGKWSNPDKDSSFQFLEQSYQPYCQGNYHNKEFQFITILLRKCHRTEKSDLKQGKYFTFWPGNKNTLFVKSHIYSQIFLFFYKICFCFLQNFSLNYHFWQWQNCTKTMTKIDFMRKIVPQGYSRVNSCKLKLVHAYCVMLTNKWQWCKTWCSVTFLMSLNMMYSSM